MANFINDKKGRFCELDTTTYVASATPLTVDCSLQDEWAVLLVDRNISVNFSNFSYGKFFTLHLTCDATPRTVTWGAAIPAAFTSVTLTASKTTTFVFKNNGTNMILISTSTAY